MSHNTLEVNAKEPERGTVHIQKPSGSHLTSLARPAPPHDQTQPNSNLAGNQPTPSQHQFPKCYW